MDKQKEREDRIFSKLNLETLPFKLKKEKIYKFKTKIDKWGSLLAFFCWLPIIGDPIAVSLGFFRTNYILVAIWMFVGKILRYLIWALITYWGASIV